VRALDAPSVGPLPASLGDILDSFVEIGLGCLDHGYALTVHQAQGLTCQRAMLLGSDTLYREAG